jgi:tetratricopeptide (TPR) repeat protein
LVWLGQIVQAQTEAKIISLSGDVKIRYGLEEDWTKAAIGVLLKDIDTILSGEDGEVVLQLKNGNTFKLGSNAILDVGDLRKIIDKELFLFLMTHKIKQVEPHSEKTKLHIGDVSVVYGESKDKQDSIKVDTAQIGRHLQEINGAKALYLQSYFTNAIVKFHKILIKYEPFEESGEIYYYLGKSFQSLKLSGQAIDAYQMVIDIYREDKREAAQKMVDEAKSAIEKLKI